MMLQNVSVWFVAIGDDNQSFYPMVLIKRDSKRKYYYGVSRSSLGRLAFLADQLRDNQWDSICPTQYGWAIFYHCQE